MGRIAELLEKKALKNITEAEQKELDALMAEAKMADDESGAGAGVGGGEDEDEDDVETAAQKMADMVSAGIESGVTKALDAIKKNQDEEDKNKGFDPNRAVFTIDEKLGKNHTVDELSEIKVALPGRKQSGKNVTEVSQKSVEFLSALYSNNKEKLQILSEGSAADGGYLVPEEFANVIVEDIRDQAIMRGLASVMTTTVDKVHIPSLVSRPRAQWRAEKAVKATSTAQFNENVLTPYSLASIVPLSNELVADAQLGVGGSIVNYIAGLMATALGEKEEEAFWTGSGSGQPTGVVGNTGRTFSAASTDVSRADTLIKAYHQTPQGYRNKAVWVANMGTLGKIGQLKDSQNRYLLTDLANSPTQTIKGRPVYESNFLPDGTALFGDFSFYQIVDREGISVRVSDEATVGGASAFEKNLTFVRVEKRVDAELLLPAAVTTVTGLGGA